MLEIKPKRAFDKDLFTDFDKDIFAWTNIAKLIEKISRSEDLNTFSDKEEGDYSTF